MKRVCCIFSQWSLLVLLLVVQELKAQPASYIEILKNAPATATFAEVQGMVEQYFRNNPTARGQKQWERWKWYAERHLDTDGRVGNITRYNMEALQQMNISTSRFGSTAHT
ncbi:MAG: hypothetical protein JNM68_00940, partial [Dinghuibacter sp.]|nr:hypothetical protein [Dinghuibacter sp.]